MRKIAENYRLPYYTMSPTYSVCKDHGYLTGEHFTCPHCGQSAEVYSRITGYYRPVQNWNDGKTQEYKERREYDLGHSSLKHAGPIEPHKTVPVADAPAAPEKPSFATPILFATATCPNCRIACSYMDKAGFRYDKILADEHPELAKEYGVKQAPTLIVPRDGGFEKIAGAGAIKQYVTQ